MNILLIIVDALRPDHLGCNGYYRETSPNIDKLSEEGVSFLNAYCTLPRTDPSIASVLTGMYPHYHGVRLVAKNKSDLSLSSLPEILKGHDYKTAFMGPAVMHDPIIEKGFDDFNLIRWRIKNKLVRVMYRLLKPKNFLGITEQHISVAKKWVMKNSNKNFFLCMHLTDLHWPYVIPNPYENMFDPNYKGKHDFITLGGGKFARGDLVVGNLKLPKEEIQHGIAHYDGGIKYIDTHLGKFFDFLRERNLEEKTLIILTSDHGETLSEHGIFFSHGSSIYEPSLKIPLVIKHPKLKPVNKKISDRVQNVDIMPTILDMLGIRTLDEIEGVSLLPLINGKTEMAREYIFAEGAEEHFKQNKKIYMSGVKGKWRVMIIDDWKIIYIPHPEKSIFELYNLKNDPKEENNLIDKEEKIATLMKKRLFDFLKGQSNEGDVALEDLTEKSKKLLKKLGYID